MKSRAQWIKDHNANPHRARLKNTQELTEVQSEITSYVDEGCRLTRPKRQFVDVESWNESLDGKFDSDQVVEREVFGVVKKGIYKQVGREGVYDEEVFTESGAREQTIEATNTGIFGVERMSLKKQQIRNNLDAVEKKKAMHAVAAPAVGLALDIVNSNWLEFLYKMRISKQRALIHRHRSKVTSLTMVQMKEIQHLQTKAHRISQTSHLA